MRHLQLIRAGALSACVAAVALLAPAQLLGSAMAGTTRTSAHSAGAFTLQESGSLHLLSKHGFKLHEQGTASGTIHGAIYVNLKIISSSKVTAEISFYPHNGSITCYGTASYKRLRTSAVFSGPLTVERGTGSYSHAHGSGLSFSGTIQRSNEAITVHVSGRASD